MVSSLMRSNVMFSGIAGTERTVDTNVLQVLPMTEKLEFVCGLIKCQNVKLKKLPTVSTAPLPVKLQTLDHSQDTLTQTTAESTTSVWKELLGNMVVQLEPCSKLETLREAATVKTPRMFQGVKTTTETWI
uniref:Uncharacterized protein n=1 Tax=Cacopsylla melanoneura TaxID=428564 RepID=A0A8D8ZU35_9HEMI